MPDKLYNSCRINLMFNLEDFKMKFRILTLLLALALVFCMVGCGNNSVDVDLSDKPAQSSEPEKTEPTLNPLTGLEMDASKIDQRPIAVMVNNIKVAQDVQAGLNDADIVYEAYAEGGITRLVAVFKDSSKIERVGSIRSARYSHIELATGHDAIYVHAGKNKTQAAPHMQALGIDNFDLNSGAPAAYGYRISNGKASEHTLYTTGEKLEAGFKALNYRRNLKSTAENWQKFVSATSPVTPAEGVCNNLSVTMSTGYVSKFTYDANTGRYTRYNSSNVSKDYNSGNSVTFKNVLVLKTDVTDFPNDSTHVVKTHLEGGEGYYVSNGGFETIKWTKGDAFNPIKITKADGSDCPYNAGNTWVSLVDKNNSVTVE